MQLRRTASSPTPHLAPQRREIAADACWQAPLRGICQGGPVIREGGRDMEPREQKDTVSRRRMLKRIGAGAAVAWTVPVLTSMRAPAFAQGSAPCETNCFYNTNFVRNPDGSYGPCREGPGVSCDNIPPTCKGPGSARIVSVQQHDAIVTNACFSCKRP